VPKLIRARNFPPSYGFAPLWPRAVLGCTLLNKLTIKGTHGMYHVAEMPVSININECTSNHSFFRFRLKFYDGAKELFIKLLNGVEEENPYSNYI